MKKMLLLIFVSFLFGVTQNSCGPNEKEIREKIERERLDSIKAAEERAEALRLEEERKYPHDGIYEWVVNFYDITGQLYREEVGCEIVKGQVVNATWYTSHARSPMTGTLDGDILHLKGNHATYSGLWMECDVDLRTGRGIVSNNLIAPTEAKFRKTN